MNFPIDRNQHKRAEDSIAAGVEVNLNGDAQSELFDTRFRKRPGSNLKDAGRNAAAATSRAGEALNGHVFKSNQWSYPSRKCPKGASIRILSQMIFVIASIGTARIAPGTPHIQYQKIKATMTRRGLSVKRRANSIGVMVSPSAR